MWQRMKRSIHLGAVGQLLYLIVRRAQWLKIVRKEVGEKGEKGGVNQRFRKITLAVQSVGR